MRAQASIENDGLGDHRQMNATRSRLLCRNSVRALATWLTSSGKLAVGDRAVSPGSPSKWMATWSPNPSATCRSTQLTATLMRHRRTTWRRAHSTSRGLFPSVFPAEPSGLFVPEGHSVANGLGVHRDAGIGLFGEFRRWREVAVLVQQVLKMIGGHQPNASVDQTLPAQTTE